MRPPLRTRVRDHERGLNGRAVQGSVRDTEEAPGVVRPLEVRFVRPVRAACWLMEQLVCGAVSGTMRTMGSTRATRGAYKTCSVSTERTQRGACICSITLRGALLVRKPLEATRKGCVGGGPPRYHPIA